MKSVRSFAVKVVEQLRDAGHQALWAGGCVRDQLLGRIPKDYDIATNATPPQVRQLFGPRRTIAIGEAFGVIAVLGPSNAFQVEVATFRKDSAYSDGRHPDRVDFCDAEEDAKRRDFTINGLFFDPITNEVIDHVGGQADLGHRLIRAIGNAEDRFNEDRLRILRAIRFATELDFQIEPQTLEAVTLNSNHVTTVSAERITSEMRRLLVSSYRDRGVRLLVETGLLRTILPECGWPTVGETRSMEFQTALLILANLIDASFPAAMASILRHVIPSEDTNSTLGRVCKRWRMTNAEEKRITELLRYEPAIRSADQLPWSQLQPILARQHASEIVDYAESVGKALGGESHESIRLCRAQLSLEPSILDPAPLINGGNLAAEGIAAGSVYKTILAEVRCAQLDQTIHNAKEAMELARRILKRERSD